ncbi:hypothetical protein BRADO7088 [Bradyrhizobium sp. ORS 278]|uniref:hypothetical protein n=1 Tax=Bradyrhizobium sp. (strain ORS 278) TaxID=114615 RepID=UPI000150872C|nr:hypothetical protein [Bradyrhizobium sp. ORS 278]CAL80671.1 hypothetical protein BRADO7088 [Bradyrhizobium sp. ORS 278]
MTPRNGHDRGLWPLDEPDDELSAEDERDLATGEGGDIELPLTPDDLAEDD